MMPRINLKINTLPLESSSKGTGLKTPSTAFPKSATTAGSQAPKADTIFSRFVTAHVFYTLGRFEMKFEDAIRSPFLMGDSSQAMNLEEIMASQHFASAAAFIHRTLLATSNVIPLTMVIYALKLVERVVYYGKKVPIKGSEGHLFATALMLSQKMSDDYSYSNKSWAKVMSMSAAQVTFIEREFLNGVNYDLAIHPKEYADWFSQVQTMAKIWEYIHDSKPENVPVSKLKQNKAAAFMPSPPLSPGNSLPFINTKKRNQIAE